MLLESIFMIRGGFFGFEFTHKLIYAIAGFFICYYDWKKNKRKDYLWVYLIGTILYTLAELMLQVFGGRAMQDKFLFGVNIGSQLWFTIPIGAMADVAFVGLLGIFIADFLVKKETRKKGILILAIYTLFRHVIFYSVFLILGFNFTNITVGDPDISSRRDVFEVGTVTTLTILSILTIIWFIRSKKVIKKRAFFMFLVIVIEITFWSVGEWITGQRWIEVGTIDPFNLQHANPFIEFGILAYDVIVEMGLFCVSFLAIPYLLKLIKTKEIPQT